jgi:hypothetical protein
MSERAALYLAMQYADAIKDVLRLDEKASRSSTEKSDSHQYFLGWNDAMSAVRDTLDRHGVLKKEPDHDPNG